MKVTCCHCGIVFDLPDQIYEQRKIDGKLFYCPNGHNQYYVENREAKIHNLEAKITNLETAITTLRTDKNGLYRRIAAYRAVITRMKKSIKSKS